MSPVEMELFRNGELRAWATGEKGVLGDDVDLGLTAPTSSRGSREESGEREGEARRRHGGRAVDGGGVELDGRGTEVRISAFFVLRRAFQIVVFIREKRISFLFRFMQLS